MANTPDSPAPRCPVCHQPMRREMDGVRRPPMPAVFWFCTNAECEEGRRNRVFHGG